VAHTVLVCASIMLVRRGAGKSARRTADEMAETRGAGRKCLFVSDFLRFGTTPGGGMLQSWE